MKSSTWPSGPSAARTWNPFIRLSLCSIVIPLRGPRALWKRPAQAAPIAKG
jgi:hypothetical protein